MNNAILSATKFKIDFDFKSAEQKTILEYLQANKFKLMGYKGATGPNQVSAGVPTWFVEPYIEMFGRVKIIFM